MIEKMFIDLNRGGCRTKIARSINARYDNGWTTHKGEKSGVVETIKVKDGTSKGYAVCPIGGGGGHGYP